VGQGKLTFTCGSSYEGNWKANKFHGQGTLTYAVESGTGSSRSDDSLPKNKEILQEEADTRGESSEKLQAHLNTGSLLDDVLYIPNVRSYQGQFENGIAHGIATIIFGAMPPSSK